MATGRETESIGGELTGPAPAPATTASSAATELSVRPGDCLGRYTVRERIGGGGIGEVFSAHDPELDRIVAVKVLRPGRAGESPEAQFRFQREAQAMARLSHPNVVAVYDVGKVGERVYVAMELIEGPTLAAWLAERPRGWREVLEVFLQAGRGLEAAHAAGLVHRDFKPTNVIVGDRVRVADFGLARVAVEVEPAGPPAATALHGVVTQTGTALGTPAYMAPEQLSGGLPSSQSDQYSFAVAVHEALCGARPGESAGGPGRNEWNRVPARLRRVLQRALSSDPADRYPAMSEMLRDLSRVTLRDVLLGMDYTFRQRAMPLLGVLAMTGQLSFYFLDGRLFGMHDSLPVRCLAAVGAMPVIFFPRETPLRTWQKVYWELAISLNLFVFPYLYLLNGMNKYWYVSIVFIGVAVGFLAKAIFMIPLSAITFVAAALAFSYFHDAVQGGILIVAEIYIVFLVTALVLSVAALGLEMTFRRALEAEAALRQAETNLKNFLNVAEQRKDT
jgi:hypothetical protein